MRETPSPSCRAIENPPARFLAGAAGGEESAAGGERVDGIATGGVDRAAGGRFGAAGTIAGTARAGGFGTAARRAASSIDRRIAGIAGLQSAAAVRERSGGVTAIGDTGLRTAPTAGGVDAADLVRAASADGDMDARTMAAGTGRPAGAATGS